jgi:hypothetical protein
LDAPGPWNPADKIRDTRATGGRGRAHVLTQGSGESVERSGIGRIVTVGQNPLNALEKNACLHVAMPSLQKHPWGSGEKSFNKFMT